MESKSSLYDLYSHFDKKLQVLCLSMAMKKNSGSELPEMRIENLFSQMSDLKLNLSLIRNKLDEQKNLLDKAKIIKSKLQSTLETANYAKESIVPHLPKNVPTQVDVSDAESVSVKTSIVQDMATPFNIQSNSSSNSKPAISISHVDECSSKNFITYLTVSEFELVPKYMKGRLTYNQVNSYIDEMDKMFQIKYKLLRQKKSTLPEKKKQLYNMYKEQENSLSKGFPFIVDADLKEHTKLRIDPTLRSIIVILRHCGRIKEIRGGGLTRYAVTSFY